MLTSDLFENKTPAAWRAGYERGLRYYRQGPDNPYPAGSEEAKDYADGYHNGELDSYDKYDTSTMNEGAVKELSQDLRSMSDEEFLTRYKMTKAQSRAGMKSGVAEGSGPKEKQKTPYRDINSPEYRAAVDKQKQRITKDKAAEPGKKMLAKQGVAEGSNHNISLLIQQYEDTVELVYDLPPGQKKNLAIDKRDALEAQIEAMPGGKEALRNWAKSYNDAIDEGVAEGSETAADIDKMIEFHKQGQAAAQYRGSMNKMHAAKIRELEAKKKALKQGVAEGSLNEFAPGAGGDDDIGDDPYKYPKPKRYNRSADYFEQFEADHFDREDFDDDTGVFKGYWGNTQIAYFKFDNPARTGGNNPGMGWYYEPQTNNRGDDTAAAPAVDNTDERKQQELSMINAFLKSGNRPNPDSQIGRLMKKHGLAEEQLTEQDLAEAVSTLELADFLFKGLEQKFPKIIERYGHEVVGNAIMDVAEENLDVSSFSEVDMLIDDIIEKLQNYNGNDSGLTESTVSRLYYNVVGTSAPELRKDFGMRHDRRGWFLSESSGRNRIMDAQRAFGSPKLVEYSVSDATGGAATLGPDNVISPVGSMPKNQRINTKKRKSNTL